MCCFCVTDLEESREEEGVDPAPNSGQPKKATRKSTSAELSKAGQGVSIIGGIPRLLYPHEIMCHAR